MKSCSIAAEPLMPTRSPAIRLAAPRTADYAVLARSIDELEEAARSRREERMLQLLERLVPEYRRAPPEPHAATASARLTRGRRIASRHARRANRANLFALPRSI